MPSSHHPTPIRIATRGSALALAQAHTVLDQCQSAFPSLSFEIQILKTTGDTLQSSSLVQQELPKGLFTKELEIALLNHQADLAVHSLKDLPTELPAGLALGAVLERADVRDVLLFKPADPNPLAQPIRSLHSLPRGATIATSSTRREALLRHHRPDLKFVPLRGNVPTRLEKLSKDPGIHATILAAAGLARLGITVHPDGVLTSTNIPIPQGLMGLPVNLDDLLPCVGQAAIGIEVRENDPSILPICQALSHDETMACVIAERAFLEGMGGGCQLAVAAHATLRHDELRLRGISFLSGEPVSGELTGPVNAPRTLGLTLASQLVR